ncbi:hypothetical protein ACFFN5_02615 [Streptomonospora salina]
MAAGLGVVMMAGTVWATTSVAQNVFVGAQPEEVMPASSMAFVKLDLKPDGSQLTDYARFVNRLPASLRDEVDPEADPAKEVVDAYIEEAELDGVTYEQDFEPWLGGRFGAAVWNAGDAGSGESGEALAVAIEAEDETAAEETLEKIRSQVDTEPAIDVDGGFAVITEDSAALDHLDSQVASGGTLAENEVYTADMDAIGADNVASAWMDLERIAALGGGDSEAATYDGYGQPGPLESLEDYEEVRGRMAVGLRIRPEYLELRGDAFDLGVDGVSLADYDVPEPGLPVMADLPDDTKAAFGGTGISDFAAQAYEDDPDEFADLEGMMSELGLTMPDGIGSLLGDSTAVGITDLGGSLDQFFNGTSSMPSLQYRAEGADSGAVEDVVERMWEGSYNSPPGVTSEGSTTIATSGTTGTGRLGDDPVFEKTMADTGSAHLGVYLDLRPVAESTDEDAPDQWGAVGASVGYTQEAISLQARWAPDGG